MNINWQQKKWFVLLPVAALLILLLTVVNKKAPQFVEDSSLAPLVAIEKATKHKIQPYVVGFGRVKPKEVWQSIAEISGRVIYRHPELETGKMLSAGTVLLKVDPVDYQLKLAQAKSDFNSSLAELKQIELNEATLKLSLEIEQKRLDLFQREYQRKLGLIKTGAVSQSTLDTEQANSLLQRQKVLELENSLQLTPADIAVAKAKIQVNESQVKEAERKLSKTEIILPFDARIAKVNAELQQVVNEHDSLIDAHRLGVMEISAQVALTDMQAFGKYLRKEALVDNEPLSTIKNLKLPADVMLHTANKKYTWQGRFVGIEGSIDPQGNTVSLVVDVDFDMRNFIPNDDIPLVNDMYVEVRVKASEQPLLAVPSSALHGSQVYILDKNGLLQIKKIEPSFYYQDLTVIESGLIEGENVILTDVAPAIVGRKLRAKENNL
jgi:multidrug efflux pump subunit AcrA (membrane-fusion protein)